jgi:hypothetical protein
MERATDAGMCARVRHSMKICLDKPTVHILGARFHLVTEYTLDMLNSTVEQEAIQFSCRLQRRITLENSSDVSGEYTASIRADNGLRRNLYSLTVILTLEGTGSSYVVRKTKLPPKPNVWTGRITLHIATSCGNERTRHMFHSAVRKHFSCC